MTRKHIHLLMWLTLLLILGAGGLPAATVIYSTVPGIVPPNMASVPYQAGSYSEFGNLVQFGAGERELTDATLVMSDWAVAASYESSDPGWYQDITLNLYNVDVTSGAPQPGSLIGSVTQNFFIPWRPPDSPDCPGSGWMAPDGCHGGIAFTLTFILTGITVPDQVIYGVAYNTETYGSNPFGSPGPYNSLNVAVSSVAPTVGSNPQPGTAYASQGSGGTFQRQTGWNPWTGAIEFTAVPEPGAAALLGLGLIGLAGIRRRGGRPHAG